MPESRNRFLPCAVLALIGLAHCASTPAPSPSKLSPNQILAPTPVVEVPVLPTDQDQAVTSLLVNHPVFEWPLEEPSVIEYFGWRKRKMHEGVDLKAHTGTPVYATAPGEVINAGRKLRRYGNLVIVDHGNGWSSIYAHLSKFQVKLGQKVKQGDLLAFSGRTGHATGPHLHFEIRKGADPVDPILFLPGLDQRVSQRLQDVRRGISGAQL